MIDDILFNGVVLSYKKIGQGSNITLMFYGYGQDSDVFDEFVREHLDTHTFYIIDLFFHGNSKWNDSEQLTNDFWLKLLLRFIEKNNLTKFDVIGYSLGAKLALVTYEAVPTRVNSLTLIAPDGFGGSFLYDFFVLNKFTLLIFKFVLDKWKFFRAIPYLLFKLGIVSKTLYRYVILNLDNFNKRERLFNTWNVFRDIKVFQSELALQFRKHQTCLTVYLSIKDELVKSKNVKDFLVKVKKYELIESNVSHILLLTKSLNEILNKNK